VLGSGCFFVVAVFQHTYEDVFAFHLLIGGGEIGSLYKILNLYKMLHIFFAGLSS
jgi:hypothetical protein